MKDGGSAFPKQPTYKMPQGVEMIVEQGGMTLRDYFAAAALIGYRCAYWQWYQRVGNEGNFAGPEELARFAYQDADAILAEREK